MLLQLLCCYLYYLDDIFVALLICLTCSFLFLCKGNENNNRGKVIENKELLRTKTIMDDNSNIVLEALVEQKDKDNNYET